jgi:succinate-semialdehyde dehydrogenase/glutarate-semialdehyde dehydrogenase
VATVAPDLLRTRAYVDGRWVDADDGATFPVLDPATGETLAEVPRLGARETRRAIEAGARALPAWKARSAKERGGVLLRLAVLMGEREDDLASLMVLEQGKPLAEARAEIAYAASFYEWFAEEAKRLDGAVIPSPWRDKRILATREPVGVTAGITPWNFPSAMVTRKSAPALAVGCTMILKPAEQTPLSALAVAALAEEAGVPAGVFSVVTGDATDAPAIGGELTSNPLVRKLGFLGPRQFDFQNLAAHRRLALEGRDRGGRGRGLRQQHAHREGDDEAQRQNTSHWAPPFAGGAGLAAGLVTATVRLAWTRYCRATRCRSSFFNDAMRS